MQENAGTRTGTKRVKRGLVRPTRGNRAVDVKGGGDVIRGQGGKIREVGHVLSCPVDLQPAKNYPRVQDTSLSLLGRTCLIEHCTASSEVTPWCVCPELILRAHFLRDKWQRSLTGSGLGVVMVRVGGDVIPVIRLYICRGKMTMLTERVRPGGGGGEGGEGGGLHFTGTRSLRIPIHTCMHAHMRQAKLRSCNLQAG